MPRGLQGLEDGEIGYGASFQELIGGGGGEDQLLVTIVVSGLVLSSSSKEEEIRVLPELVIQL